MRSGLTALLFSLVLAGCDLWTVQPQPFPIWSPIPSRTPGVLSPTPVIIAWTPTATLSTDTPILTTAPVTQSPASELEPETLTPTTPTRPPIQAVQADILGCNTSFDITHAMYEVTNAYVIIKNTGSIDLGNSCGTLRALDEDREHPDKVRCVENLPIGYEVTQKLTVDSAYKQSTAIQVDVSSDGILLLRVDQESCRDISLFGGAPADVGVIRPSTP